MNDNIVEFPGNTYGKINPDKVAKALLEDIKDFESVLVCGFTKDGDFYLASSEGEIKENLWLIENVKMQLWNSMAGED
jgi:hypothetical protein